MGLPNERAGECQPAEAIVALGCLWATKSIWERRFYIPQRHFRLPEKDEHAIIATSGEGAEGRVATIGFVLIDGFAMLGFAAMIDPVHAASRRAGYPDYRVRTLSTGAQSVRAANGVVVTVDASITDDQRYRYTPFVLPAQQDRTGRPGQSGEFERDRWLKC